MPDFAVEHGWRTCSPASSCGSDSSRERRCGSSWRPIPSRARSRRSRSPGRWPMDGLADDPDDAVALAPLADGGEGTLDAISAAGGWITLPAAARDPLMRPLDARFLRQGAAGRGGAGDRHPGCRASRRASGTAWLPRTFGTGQVLAAAIGLGCRDIVLGPGRQRHHRRRRGPAGRPRRPAVRCRRQRPADGWWGAAATWRGSTSTGCRRCWGRST